jgi:protein phosphatase
VSAARRWAAGARTIDLPAPVLVVLVGAAGSGKTTLAARLFETDEVLSSDAYRERISGDPADQTVSRTAFAILHRELARRMAARRTTVVDATNVTVHARRSLVRRAATHDIPAVAIVLDLDPLLVLARNATRPGRIVPEKAVRGQLRDLARSLRRGELTDEGFAAVHHLRAASDLDALALRRAASSPRAASGGAR